jgi:hypothetical protein
MAPALLVLAALASGFVPVGESVEVRVESRPVPGSAYPELQLTALAPGDVEVLCARAFGSGKMEPGEPHLVLRRVLAETPDDRLTYERIAPPMVAHRDFAIHSWRTRPRPGVCRIDFELDQDHAPALEAGWVRLRRLSGSFAFEAQGDGQVRVTHLLHMDPGGEVPAWLVEGTHREMSVTRLRQMLRPGPMAAATRQAAPPQPVARAASPSAPPLSEPGNASARRAPTSSSSRER